MYDLLMEDGKRWMSESEQFHTFLSSRELHPLHPRPVWLVLSIIAREQGHTFSNGIDVNSQMENIRKALKIK